LFILAIFFLIACFCLALAFFSFFLRLFICCLKVAIFLLRALIFAWLFTGGFVTVPLPVPGAAIVVTLKVLLTPPMVKVA